MRSNPPARLSGSQEAARCSCLENGEQDEGADSADCGERKTDIAIRNTHINRCVAVNEAANDLDNDSAKQAKSHAEAGAGDGKDDRPHHSGDHDRRPGTTHFYPAGYRSAHP